MRSTYGHNTSPLLHTTSPLVGTDSLGTLWILIERMNLKRNILAYAALCACFQKVSWLETSSTNKFSSEVRGFALWSFLWISKYRLTEWVYLELIHGHRGCLLFTRCFTVNVDVFRLAHIYACVKWAFVSVDGSMLAELYLFVYFRWYECCLCYALFTFSWPVVLD